MEISITLTTLICSTTIDRQMDWKGLGTIFFDGTKQSTRQELRGIQALGLDFGAVDILYMASNDTAKVLEVNTAPGIEGDTLVDYYNAFMKEIS